MSLFPNSRLAEDELPLSGRLQSAFYSTRDKIRWDRNIKDDCILHSIKNKRTRNTAVIKDTREFDQRTGKLIKGDIRLTVHSRKKHSAANIHETSYIVEDRTYTSFSDTDLAARIGVRLNEESEYSRTTFERVKMTKKLVDQLADDECTGGKIVKMGNVTPPDGILYWELIFENDSGRLVEPAEKVLRYTNNPVGNYVVINKSYHVAFYTPERFHEFFYPEECDAQVSRPADLFEPAFTQPGALI